MSEQRETKYVRYIDKLENELRESHSRDEIMALAVGGSFEAMGVLEREFLIQQGLAPDGYVIDVGCGSGRLALPLSEYLKGRYLGIDIVPKLVAYAQELVGRPDWRFEVAQGLKIPEADEQADLVCFFSVLTHLRHEESYLYLQEARRVLKPTGKIIFSFLEFPNPYLWQIFEHNIATVDGEEPLNQFMSMDAIYMWALHLGLHVTAINRAGKFRLPRPFKLQNGQVLQGEVAFGQSLCVLSRLPPPAWRQRLATRLFWLGDRLQRVRL